MKVPDHFDDPDRDDYENNDDVECKFCGVMGLYWGDHWGPDGKLNRRLFSTMTNRLHSCSAAPSIPDADDFGVVK